MTGEEGRGGEDLIYLRLRVERIKGWSSFHMSQPCSSQPPSLEGRKRRGGTEEEEIRRGFNRGHSANYTAIKE